MKLLARGLGYLILLILSLLLLAFLYLRFVGLTVPQLSFQDVEIEQLELKLDPGIWISAASVSVQFESSESEQEETDEPLDLKQVRDGIAKLNRALDWISRIQVDRLQINQITGSFNYTTDQPGRLNLEGEQVKVALRFFTRDGALVVGVDQANLRGKDVQIRGEVTLDPDERQVSAQLHAELAETLPVELSLVADREQLNFQGRGLSKIQDIRPVVDLFGLRDTITIWFLDYLDGSDFDLEELSGQISFDDPATALTGIYARARVREVAYTFAEALDPVEAPEVMVEFEQGILNIYPEQPVFYGQSAGDNSMVDIDFTLEDFLLTVRLDAEVQASGGILAVLENYEIPFPFEQLEGLTQTQLEIGILLDAVTITADGHFKASDSRFRHKNLEMDVDVLDLELDTTRITFNQLGLAMGNNFKADLTGVYDGWEGQGDLELAVSKLRLGQEASSLRLLSNEEQPTLIGIALRPESTQVDLPEALWASGEDRISAQPTSVEVDLATLSGDFSKTRVSLNQSLVTEVGGQFNAETMQVSLQADLLRLELDKLSLRQPVKGLTLEIDKGFRLVTRDPMELSLIGMPLEVWPGEFHLEDNHLVIQQGGFHFNQILRSKLRGRVNLAAGGEIELMDLTYDDGVLEPPLEIERLRLRLSQLDSAPKFTLDTVGLSLQLNPEGGWLLECPDIAPLYFKAEALQTFLKPEGHFQIKSPPDSERLAIQGELHLKQPLLVEGEQLIERMTVEGWQEGQTIMLEINDKLKVDWGRELIIESRGVGYSMAVVSDFFDDDSNGESTDAKTPEPEQEAASSPLSIRFKAVNTFLWLDKDRRVLADLFTVNYFDGQVNAVLSHGAGKAYLATRDDKIWVDGQNFGPEFIRSMIMSLEKTEQGRMDFRLRGTLQEFEAAVGFRDTVLKDYKALNNMLAFLNTIPGLVGFNPPEYSSNGLFAKEISGKLNYKDRKLELTSMLVDSSELTIKGTGEIDMDQNELDMTFNLTTGIKKSLSRIPLLGYILVGDDNQTIALKVEGDINDPEVSHTTVQEIVTYPFKLIGRTLMLPVHIADEVKTEGETQP